LNPVSVAKVDSEAQAANNVGIFYTFLI
jgi:hypothetical protein